MYSPIALVSAVAGIATVVSAGQVNFYSDGGCQNYIGSDYNVPSGQITGYKDTDDMD